MKFVKITTAYPFYLHRFYNEHPGLDQKPYQNQKGMLDYDGFGWADFWEAALTPLGYETREFLANAEPMQKTWAQENGITYREENWVLAIVEAQILKEKPEILFVVDYVVFTREWITELREKCPSIKVVLGWCGAPYPDEDIFKAYDVTLSCIPELAEHFRNLGHKSEHLHHAFEPRILTRLDLEVAPHIDFSFVGQIVRNNRFHMEREYILENLISHVDLKMFCPSAELGLKDDLKVTAKRIVYYILKLMKSAGLSTGFLSGLSVIGKGVKWKTPPVYPVNQKLKPFMHLPVFGIRMFQTLHDSKTTFNSHIDISPRSASNMRLFESTGAGTCLVTDWKENIHDLFEPDKEVVTYKTPEECVEKVKWLIEHPVQRELIAKAGQARTLRDHTFARRAEVLDHIIRRELN